MKKLTTPLIPLMMLLLCFNNSMAQESFFGLSQEFGFNTQAGAHFWNHSPIFTFNTQSEDESTEIIVYSGLFSFDTRQFTITAASSPAGAGSISGAGNFVSQQSVVLIAEPNEGYHFINWTEGGVVVSYEAQYSFTAEADRELIAHFIDTDDGTYVIDFNQTSIQVYPNPASHYTHIVSETLIRHVRISDISGKELKKIRVMDNQADISTHELDKGMYLLYIHTQKGNFVKKLQVMD